MKKLRWRMKMMKWIKPNHLVHPVDPVLLPKLNEIKKFGRKIFPPGKIR